MKLWRSRTAGGLIAYYGLTEWWLCAFTEKERKYIDERYRPSGYPPHTLTQGKLRLPKPATQFLNELSTWFRAPGDSSVAERLHRKVDELGRTSPMVGPGYYRGRHYTTYVSDVKDLKRSGRLEDAEALLLGLVEATEAQSAEENCGVAPWYYEELAKIYRRRRAYEMEVRILERFARQTHAPGVKPGKLLDRLERARELASRDRG